jgi:hypothetical protein
MKSTGLKLKARQAQKGPGTKTKSLRSQGFSSVLQDGIGFSPGKKDGLWFLFGRTFTEREYLAQIN